MIKVKAKKGEKVHLLQVKAKKGEKVQYAEFEAEKKVGSKRDTENRGRNHYLGLQKVKRETENRGRNHYLGEAEKKVGSKRDTENRSRNHYLGVQRAEAVGGFGYMNRAIENKKGSGKRIVEAVAGFVAGFGGMNRAIEDKEGSEKRIVEAVAGFGGMIPHYHNFVSVPKTVSYVPYVCLLSCSGLLMLRLLCFRLYFNRRRRQKGNGNCGGKISSCECGTESERNGVQSKAAEPRPCHRRTRIPTRNTTMISIPPIPIPLSMRMPAFTTPKSIHKFY